MSRFDNRGMIGEAQVVVGAEIDDFAAADANRRTLRRLDLTLALVEPLRAQVFEFVPQVSNQACIAHWLPRRIAFGSGYCIRLLLAIGRIMTQVRFTKFALIQRSALACPRLHPPAIP